MSWKSRSNGNRTNRGGRTSSAGTRGQAVHRWQDSGAASGRARARSRNPISRWFITTLVGAGLLFLLLALLFIREWRTQVIILTATDYSLPAPLNPWAVEDGNALKELAQENLTPVTDISDKWNAQPNLSTLLRLLEEEIEQTKAPLIVYISMHGIVNEERIPCLLPPGVGAHETTKLMPVRRVLEHISQLTANRRNALVILDCNRIRASWNLGIVYNTFTERLQEVLKANPVSNVAVLCSAGAGQLNWASADLQGSSFGRYLQLGLAGEADAGESANGDGEVTLHELVAYLEREVNAWSEFNRGESQKPALVSGDAEDFRVAYNVRDSATLAALVSKFYSQKTAEPEKRSDIAALWAQLERLRAQGLVRIDPLACRDFEFGLLRLEALCQGGSAYRQSAEDELNVLKEKLSRAVGQRAAAADSRSVSDHFGLGAFRVAAHTLPMAEYFGVCDAQQSERIGQLWSAPVKLAGDTAPLESASGERELEIARSLAEMQLLLAARDQGVASLWPSQEPLTSALKLRNRAEELAVPRGPKGIPGDERAHYFPRYVLNVADEQRRLVEDVLFIGPRSGQDFSALAADARELYESASELMQEATAAYAVRDAALAEAPYLGWWLCGPANLEVPDRKALINELIELIRQTRALDQSITSPEELNEADASPGSGGLRFEHLASAALKHHQTLKDAFQRKHEDLLSAGAQGTAGWTALESALTTPLVPADQRGALLAKRDEVSEQLFVKYSETKQAAHDEPADDNTGPSNSPAGDDSISPYLEGMEAWDSHPLVEIVPGEEIRAAKRNLDWCDEVAKHLRSRLVRLGSYERDGAGATELAGNDIFGDRRQLSRAESELRALASLGFGLGGIKVDPIIALREFDLRQLLAWHGKRMMDDFWGNASGVDEPFFVRAARHYLDAARSLGSPTPAFDGYIGELEERLAQLDEAKRKQLELNAAPQLVNELERNVAVQLHITANSSAYPSGRGSVYLRDQSRQRFDIQFENVSAAGVNFVAYPPTGAPQNFVMTILRAPSDVARAEAVSFFRGQEDTDPFEMPTFKGVRIEYEPYVYNSQSITLFGDRPEPLSLVFILDCSDSMDAKTKVEAKGNETRERMQLAKDNLTSMLEEIVKRNQDGEGTRVGIRFFGHRLGWYNAQRLGKSEYKGTIEEGLTPSEDVELVRPLGRFESLPLELEEKIESIKPWGETPLYLSMLKALDDFNSDGDATRKTIIAITDGIDDQSLHHLSGPRPKKTTLKMLLDEWQLRSRTIKIPIHILGFDIDAAEAAEARAAYEEIERVTGGSYTEIESGGDLLNNLREHLNVAGYTVRQVTASNRDAPQQFKLRTKVDIPDGHPLPDKFQVEFLGVKKEVHLEGGEAIELHVEKKSAFHDIVAREYNERTPLDYAQLTSGAGGTETDLILRVHRPVRQQGSESVVEFPVSLQRHVSASHFTPRPAETWLEIAPLSVDNSGQTVPHQPYVFYDTNFEPNEPVPVLVCPAMDWHDWPKARISFWCKYRVTKPILEIGLGDMTYRTPQNVTGVDGIQLRVETFESGGVFRVYVAENHSRESPGVDDGLRIEFQTQPQYKPLRVRHQFDKDKGLATHSFEFRASDAQAIKNFDGSRVVVTRAADIKDGALQLAADAPLDVGVQLSGGYHTTGAISNGQ